MDSAKTDDMQRQLEEAVARANESAFAAEVANFELNQIFNNATDGMWIVTLDGLVQRVNDTLVNILGRPREELLGRACREVMTEKQCVERVCPIQALRRGVRHGVTRTVRETMLMVNGEPVPHLLTATPFYGIDGGMVGIVGNFRDISEQKRAEESIRKANAQLKKLATTDGLTGLLNRRRLDECLEIEWRRLARERLPLAVILCDVDFFKLFNDRYGHQAGDDCLKAVASAIRGRVRRPADAAGRYGGEEFSVILPNTHIEGAVVVAEAIREAVERLRIEHCASSVSACVSLSLGVAAVVPTHAHSASDLLRAADRALYQAKEGGRNRVATAPVDAPPA